MEKIYQKSHKVPLKLLRQGMKQKVKELEKKYSESLGKYDIKYRWVPSRNTLSIESRHFNIQTAIVFSKGLVTCYADIPFYLRATGGSYIKKALRKITREINIYLESFK